MNIYNGLISWPAVNFFKISKKKKFNNNKKKVSMADVKIYLHSTSQQALKMGEKKYMYTKDT